MEEISAVKGGFGGISIVLLIFVFLKWKMTALPLEQHSLSFILCLEGGNVQKALRGIGMAQLLNLSQQLWRKI